ncbi:hypothetical protein [Helicobacter cetorum]|uniref:Uncharacterized protein n=1 Tax=Helicobacter cetorum (strain ATCC BAA-540 / CCUG 52418 / MIT 99-5656) TaxID=1163745 RepID=I0ETK9_HELCM|nr:hypothetical protein [Helicobacter cetorum]AFI06278.1 hypothetical protein HCD_06380 [Helicobacter cetorum MIT 99-5656]
MLFLKKQDSSVYFLDIKDHQNFSSIDFIKTIHNNWPFLIEKYKIKTGFNIRPILSSDEIFECWKKGLNVSVVFKDRNNLEVAYLPELGTTVSDHKFLHVSDI